MYKPSVLEVINRMQINIIVHSIIYYKMDDNIWDDAKFDEVCNQLVGLKSSKEFKKSRHYQDFKDFDGDTGCHLAEKYYVQYGHIANRVLNLAKLKDFPCSQS